MSKRMPPLAGTARRVVEHAVAFEHLHFSVVHHHGNGDDDLPFGVAKHLVQTGLEIEQLGGAVEAAHHRLERILLVQEAVLIRHDDAISRQSKIGGHLVENSAGWAGG